MQQIVDLENNPEYQALNVPLVSIAFDSPEILAAAGAEYGVGSTSVLELEKSVTDYEKGVSDHRPVLSVFQSP